jgi:hypothetical protein
MSVAGQSHEHTEAEKTTELNDSYCDDAIVSTQIPLIAVSSPQTQASPSKNQHETKKRFEVILEDVMRDT